LVRRVAAIARSHGNRNSVTASLSAFVPKPHTPFQWERQIGREEITERIGTIRSIVGRNRNAEVKFHSPEVSELEGTFSRGDARLADVLLRAYRLGARFDAWTEEFRADLWVEAFRDAGVDPGEYRREKDPAEPLPWDFVDAGIDRDFLLDEREKTCSGETTPDCRRDVCSACGACPPGLRNITFPSAGEPARDPPPAETGTGPEHPPEPAVRCLLRIRYAKEGPARYLSGLELQSLWGRVLRKAGLPVAYSRGFNPAPRLSFSPALPVGTESLAEFLEAEFSLPVPAFEAERRIPPCLPGGISLIEIHQVSPGSPRLSGFDLSCVYAIRPVPPEPFPDGITPESAARAWDRFSAAEEFPVTTGREATGAATDLRRIVTGFLMKDGRLFITIIHGSGKGVRPLDAAAALLGVGLAPDRFTVTKISADTIPRGKD